MAAGPLGEDHGDADALRAERDALARRAAAAERRAEELERDLAEVREQLGRRNEATEPGLSLFEGGSSTGSPVAGDGTDPRALSIVLAATAVVAGMVTVLAFLNGTLFTWFGIGMTALTAGLTYAAAATRVEPVSVHLTRGVVYVEKGESKYRFDLRQEDTRVEQHGRPGDSDWRITFARRHTGPFAVDATMVDPAAFVAEVRQYRPSIR